MTMNKTSWADQSDFDQNGLPPPSEKIDGDTKIITDYKDVDGKKFKVTRTYKMERKQVSKAVAQRKAFAKYGDSKHDPAGPNAATTVVAEEIFMQFLSVKGGVEEAQITEEDLQTQAKLQLSKTATCRVCHEDHWTTHCPHKGRVSAAIQLDDSSKAAAMAANAASKVDPAKYMPPSMREGGGKRGEMMGSRQSKDDSTIRVTNLSEEITDRDLNELFRQFGNIPRIYLAKDKVTNNSKGFAFISFANRASALAAVATLNGHGYDNLILSVEMANKANN